MTPWITADVADLAVITTPERAPDAPSAFTTSWPGIHPPSPDRADVARAQATVPRGSSGTDPSSTPAVSLEVWTLHVQLQRTGDPEVLATLVQQYRCYAQSIARRLVRHGDALEDIEQVAMEALVASLRRFDVGRRIPFAGFARPTISGAIKRHYRDRGWSVRTPRSVHDHAGPLRAAEERLTAEHGHRPDRAELAEAVGLSEADVRRVDQAIRARDTTSLDQPAPDGGPSRREALGAVDADLARADALIDLREALGHLDDRERSLLELYYVEEVSQREIGARLGVSQMQVSRWLSSCVGRLRGRMRVSEG